MTATRSAPITAQGALGDGHTFLQVRRTDRTPPAMDIVPCRTAWLPEWLPPIRATVESLPSIPGEGWAMIGHGEARRSAR